MCTENADKVEKETRAAHKKKIDSQNDSQKKHLDKLRKSKIADDSLHGDLNQRFLDHIPFLINSHFFY